MNKTCIRDVLFAVALATVLPGSAALAAGYEDHESLAGLKEVKVAFDLTAGDAKALLGRLNVIDETRQSLIQQVRRDAALRPHLPRPGDAAHRDRRVEDKAGRSRRRGQDRHKAGGAA